MFSRVNQEWKNTRGSIRRPHGLRVFTFAYELRCVKHMRGGNLGGVNAMFGFRQLGLLACTNHHILSTPQKTLNEVIHIKFNKIAA